MLLILTNCVYSSNCRIRRQSPQCEGDNPSRILFNARLPVRKQRNLITLTRDEHALSSADGPLFHIDVGAADGTAIGARFLMYAGRDPRPDETALGELCANAVGATSTILRLLPTQGGNNFDVPETAYADQISPGLEADLRIHISSDPRLTKACSEAVDQVCGDRQYIRIYPQGEVDLDLRVSITTETNDKVAFDNLHSRSYGLERMPSMCAIEASDLARVFHSASHFFWHLRRSRAPKAHSLQEQVELQFFEVVEDGLQDNEGWRILTPVGENMVKDNRIQLTVMPEKRYGVKIVNKSATKSLFPYLFYFDCSDFSIGMLSVCN